jgi:hypothetical protein
MRLLIRPFDWLLTSSEDPTAGTCSCTQQDYTCAGNMCRNVLILTKSLLIFLQMMQYHCIPPYVREFTFNVGYEMRRLTLCTWLVGYLCAIQINHHLNSALHSITSRQNSKY